MAAYDAACGGVEPGQVGGHGVADLGEQRGVEPEVRVDVAVLVVVARAPRRRALVSVAQVDHVGDVEHPALGVLLDGLVDGGLEAVLDHDEVGPGQRDGAREGRLDVVGLHAGVGEADHVDVGAADPLGDPGQRVEAGRHLDPAVVGRQRRAPGEGRDEEQGRQPAHENDSQHELRIIVKRAHAWRPGRPVPDVSGLSAPIRAALEDIRSRLARLESGLSPRG